MTIVLTLRRGSPTMYMITEHVYALVGCSLASHSNFLLPLYCWRVNHVLKSQFSILYCSNFAIVFFYMIIVLLFKSEHVYHNKNGQNIDFDCPCQTIDAIIPFLGICPIRLIQLVGLPRHLEDLADVSF